MALPAFRVLESGVLWTPDVFGPRKWLAKETILRLPSGERVRVTVSDCLTITQVEHDDRLDGIARPKAIQVKVRG